MGSEDSYLIVKVLNCKDLKPGIFSLLRKHKVYVQTRLTGSTIENRRRCDHDHVETPAKEKVDGEYEWNYEMKFHLECSELDDGDWGTGVRDLRFAFFTARKLLAGDRLGYVVVPFKDLADGYGGGLTYRSYQVQGCLGRGSAVFSFAYRIHLKQRHELNHPRPAEVAQMPNMGDNYPHQPQTYLPRLRPPGMFYYQHQPHWPPFPTASPFYGYPSMLVGNPSSASYGGGYQYHQGSRFDGSSSHAGASRQIR
uniref:C2 domain-containing protein n=1 Tax=Kalanchoe fedtschenkoi TaxID=63787 RepID=A0A7N0TP83_KALFE